MNKRCLHSYTIMIPDLNHLEEICQDIKEQYESGVCSCALFEMTLVPEGNPPADKVTILCKKYEKFKQKLDSMGIPNGVLVQASVGHGWVLGEMFPYQTHVNFNDGKATRVVCPCDNGFKEYIYNVMATIASYNPDHIMVDDDFRTIWYKGEGCACPIEKGGVIKGIMWLQGDSDAANDGYLDNLKIFVDDLRADLNLNENEVPFIASQYVPAKVEQNAAIANIASTVTNSDYISSEGTDSVGDNLHFDGESQRLLGCRYAEKIMNKVYGKNITATELYNSVYLVRPDDLPDAFNVPIDKFTSDEEENDSVTVKNHLGEMQTITGHYMVLLTKVAPGTSDYTLEEYGISISEDGINYHQDAKSLVELTANNAYCMLVHNLKASKTYYFRPYAVYKDASGNLWTVNGEEVITHEVK